MSLPAKRCSREQRRSTGSTGEVVKFSAELPCSLSLLEPNRHPNSQSPTKFKVTITIDEDLVSRIAALHVPASTLVLASLRKEIKRREQAIELRMVRAKDPRVTLEDLRKHTVKMRRLREL